MTTKLSIIIPVYNAEIYLNECIDSILSQSFDNFELIIVNDGSTDHSKEILEKYAKSDGRIKLLNKKNSGASSARNLGLQQSCGEWIVFVDSDDYLPEGALSNMVQKGDKKNVDLSIFNAEKLIQTTTLGPIYKFTHLQYETYQEVIREILRGTMLTGPFSKLFRGVIARKIRFNEDLVIGEDLYYILNFLQISQQDVYFDHTIVYVYRYVETSITNSKKNLLSYWPLDKKIVNILSEKEYGQDLRTMIAGNLMWCCFFLHQRPSKEDLKLLLPYYRRGVDIPKSYAEYKYLQLASKSAFIATLYFYAICLFRWIKTLKGKFVDV